MTWLGEEMIVLGASFFGARLGATRALRHGIARDDRQHLVNQFVLASGRLLGGVDGRREVSHRIKGAFEADPRQFHVMPVRGLLHQEPDQM
jgi:hypothetical protein